MTVPDAGEIFMAADNEKEARTISLRHTSHRARRSFLHDTKQRTVA